MLGRNDENADIAQTYPVQNVGALGHGQQAVERRAAIDVFRFEPCDLIRHQGNQRRNDDRQRAGLVEAGERRNLVTQRFTCACREDAQQVFTTHRRFNNALLSRRTIFSDRVRTKLRETEPVSKFFQCIVVLPTPVACRVATGGIAQFLDQHPRFWKLVPHPRRHHRVATRHRQPSQRVRQPPAVVAGIVQNFATVRLADLPGKLPLNCFDRFCICRTRFTP